MKNFGLIITCCFVLLLSGCGPVKQTADFSGNKSAEIKGETWQLQGLAFEQEYRNGSLIMADVLPIDDGTYRMYYTVNAQDHKSINLAVSEDALHWKVQGVVLDGATEKTDREFEIGGPSVIKLTEGGYRMYYRTSEQVKEGHPHYHIRSAYSEDGIVFIRDEGVRIDLNQYDDSSDYILIGHSRMFMNDEGTYVAILTANKIGDNGPSDIFVASSQDGMDWEIGDLLYKDWHDPAVSKKDGIYYMHATYLLDKKGVATSVDGIHWDKQMQTIELIDGTGTTMTIDQYGLGDLSTVVTHGNEMLMFTNYGENTASNQFAIFKKVIE